MTIRENLTKKFEGWRERPRGQRDAMKGILALEAGLLSVPIILSAQGHYHGPFQDKIESTSLVIGGVCVATSLYYIIKSVVRKDRYELN